MPEEYDFEEDVFDSDQEENEEEKEDYGKKVQKRIAKEVSKRKALEDQLHDLSSKLNEFELKTQEKEHESTLSTIDSRLNALRAKRTEMYEVGDIDPDIEDQWQDLRLEKRIAETSKPAPKVTRNQEAARSIPDAQQEWMDENEWYSDDSEKRENANKIFSELLEAGYSDQHPGTYKEFNKRLKGREQAPSPAATSKATPSKNPKAKLTQDDFSMMVELGLDPKNAEHRKRLLANKGAV